MKQQQTHLFISAIVDSAWCVIFKIYLYCQDQCQEVLPLCFLLVSGLLFKCLIDFKLIFVSGIKQTQFYFSAYDLVFLTPLNEENILSRLSRLASRDKYQLIAYIRIYFWTLNCVPWVYVSIFLLLVIYSFDYYIFFSSRSKIFLFLFYFLLFFLDKLTVFNVLHSSEVADNNQR